MVVFPMYFLVLSSVIISIMCQQTNHTEKNIEGFVVGGDYANYNDFPHAVCLYSYSLSYFCGSSVLTERVLLTAAHCMEFLAKTWKIEAFAGHKNVEQASIIRNVTRYIIHEGYDTDTVQNDMAMLFLDGDTIPLGGSSPVKRVIIKKEFPFEVKTAYISGWGVTDDYHRQMSTVMKFTSQTVLSLHDCRTKPEDTSGWLPGMMCAGDLHSDTDRPTRGDSGSGLMAHTAQLIGLVSYTMPPHLGLIYYSNISYFYDWIVKTVDDKICIDDTD